jgi:hypothetical protein
LVLRILVLTSLQRVGLEIQVASEKAKEVVSNTLMMEPKKVEGIHESSNSNKVLNTNKLLTGLRHSSFCPGF